MPCYDPRDNEDNELCKGRLDLATRLLCSVLKTIERDGLLNISAYPELDAWWEEHQELDKQRLQGEE